MSKPKIYIGNYDIASQISDLKIVFKELGIETLTASSSKANIVRGNVDYKFTDYKKKHFRGVRPRSFQKWLQNRFNIERKIWRKALKECDVFIFIWHSFQPDFSDFKELKGKGKKVINCFVGNDARWYVAAKQEYEYYGMKAPAIQNDYNYKIDGLKAKLSHIRMAEKYCDFVFSRLDQAQLQLRPYYRWNMMVIPEQIPHKPIQRETRPIILHAPSNRSAKGTKYILAAFDRLKEEGFDFETILLENVPNEEAVVIYSNADVIIDQLIYPGTGKFATEALAAGKVVMAHMNYKGYPQNNPQECPIIDVNPDTVYNELKSIIQDYKKRQELANRGRRYVYEHLDLKIFCKTVLDLCSGKKIPFDYKPDFFRNHFIPESDEALIEYNNWNGFVKGCDWYQESVPSGERDGLVF